MLSYVIVSYASIERRPTSVLRNLQLQDKPWQLPIKIQTTGSNLLITMMFYHGVESSKLLIEWRKSEYRIHSLSIRKSIDENLFK